MHQDCTPANIKYMCMIAPRAVALIPRPAGSAGCRTHKPPK